MDVVKIQWLLSSSVSSWKTILSSLSTALMALTHCNTHKKFSYNEHNSSVHLLLFAIWRMAYHIIWLSQLVSRRRSSQVIKW